MNTNELINIGSVNEKELEKIAGAGFEDYLMHPGFATTRDYPGALGSVADDNIVPGKPGEQSYGPLKK